MRRSSPIAVESAKGRVYARWLSHEIITGRRGERSQQRSEAKNWSRVVAPCWLRSG